MALADARGHLRGALTGHNGMARCSIPALPSRAFMAAGLSAIHQDVHTQIIMRRPPGRLAGLEVVVSRTCLLRPSRTGIKAAYVLVVVIEGSDHNRSSPRHR